METEVTKSRWSRGALIGGVVAVLLLPIGALGSRAELWTFLTGFMFLGAGAILATIGVVVGIVGVSNLLKWLLDRFAKPTLGALLGLLLGAVVGLWHFQNPVPPQPGDRIGGQVVTAEELGAIEVDDWRVEIFTPAAGQVGGSLALVALGLGATLLVARFGDSAKES